MGAGWKELRRGITICLLFVPTLLVCLPIVLLVTGSVMGNGELRQYLAEAGFAGICVTGDLSQRSPAADEDRWIVRCERDEEDL